MAYIRKIATSKMRNDIVYPKLKTWMDENKTNPCALAKIMGCARVTLYDYLEGRTESLKLIRKVKEITHLKWEDLIKD